MFSKAADTASMFLSLHIRKVAVTFVFAGFALLAWKVSSAFFERQQQLWEMDMQKKLNDLVMLKPMEVREAQRRIDVMCGAFSLDGQPEAGCDEAKATFARVSMELEELKKGEKDLLSQAKGTQRYYKGFYESLHLDPMKSVVIGVIGIIALALGGLCYAFAPSIQKFLARRGQSCSADGLE